MKNGEYYVVSEHIKGAAATCTTAQTCTECGYVFVAVLGHTEGAEATCTTAQICTVCNAVLVEALGHNLVDVEGKSATCTEDGYTAYKDCSRCDYIEGKETILAGHSLKEVAKKAATCTEAGYTAHKACENCDYTEGKTVLPAGHVLVDVNGKDATCTEAGYTAHKACENCDYTEGKTVLPAGHVLVDVNGKDATCTEAGYTAHKTCENCDYTEGKTILSAGHDLKDVNGKDATCTEDGYTAYKDCSRCDYIEGKETIPAEHKLVDVVAKDATCTEAGYTAHKACENCDYTEGKTILSAGHNLVDAEGKDATCTEAGYTAHKACENCDYTEGKIVTNATGHDFVDGECENDGCIANQTINDVIFELGENGDATHKETTTTKATYSETNGEYTLSITGAAKFYPNSNDAKGNSCIKLGTGSDTASFSFVVPENITEVIMFVAGYKANKASVVVNGTTYEISTTSDSGTYTEIRIDTSATKTINFTTNSYPDERAMLNTIVFRSVGDIYDCAHQYEENRVEATCTVDGSITYTCTNPECGKTKVTVIPATGHNYDKGVVTNPTCTEAGYTTYTCSCGTTRKETIKATGHNYVNGTCSSCGEKESAGGNTPALDNATLSFANKAQRTTFNSNQQVWEQNGIKFTNNKASSTNAVADYASPARLYAGSSVIVEAAGITKIVFDCSGSSYATALKNSIGTVSGVTVTVSSDKVTVTFSEAVDSFAISKLTAQVRIDSITVNP